jgi:outer membrane protein assembly factor BamB
LTLALVLMAAPALAADAPAHASGAWPRFRGPDGSGVSPDAFDQPITERDFAWKIELPGAGHSSPVVWGDKVYLTCGEAFTAKRIVLCLNASDGSVAWRKEYNSFTFSQHHDNSYASSSPAVDDVGVYVAWTTPKDYTLLALDHEGKELWRQDLGPFKSQWGSGTSPIVVRDLVIVANDQEGPSCVAAFDHKTGKPRWTVDRKGSDKTAMCTPCLFHPKAGSEQLIVTSKASGLVSLDPETGRTVWQIPNAFPFRTVGSPVTTDDMVIATFGDGANDRRLIAVRPGKPGAYTPEIAYKLTRTPSYVPTPLVKDDLLFLFADNGQVTCAKVETGETVWSEKVARSFYGSPVCAGKTLWCIAHDGELIGIEAADHYNLVGKLDLGEPSQATPAVADGRMYLRTVSHLICVKK